MSSSGVVKAVDVLKQCLRDLATRLPGVPPDELSFQCFEEGLDGGIVVAIAFTTHGHLEAQFPQSLLIVVRAILAPPVRVLNAPRRWVSKGDRSVQSL